jgi:hypothetical protein
MQVPSNMLLNKFGKPSIYIPIAMILWGILSILTGVTHKHGHLILIAFFTTNTYKILALQVLPL